MVTINLRGATGTQWLHSFTLRVARVCTIYQLKREWASEGPVYTPHGEMYDHCPHIDCLPSSVRGRGTDAEEGSNGGVALSDVGYFPRLSATINLHII